MQYIKGLWKYLGFLTLATSVSAAHVFAQTANATLIGVVRDQTGTAMIGVQVTATQERTGLERTTISAPGGSFSLPSIAAGRYSVTASQAGFRTQVLEGVVLGVGVKASIDIVMFVGPVEQRVVVQAEPGTVNVAGS